MSGWRRLYAKPAGSLPGGIVTQWGVGIITILVLLLLSAYIYFGGGEEAELEEGAETVQDLRLRRSGAQYRFGIALLGSRAWTALGCVAEDRAAGSGDRHWR